MEPSALGKRARPDRRGLRARSLELLDFLAIRERVADKAKFPIAKAMASGMEPAYEPAEVLGLLAETDDGLAFLENYPDIDLYTDDRPLHFARRAALEGTLTGQELIAVASFSEVISRARRVFRSVREVAPRLASMAERIPDLTETQCRITSAIGGHGEVLDGASPVLGETRVRVRQAYTLVSEAMDRIMNSTVGKEVLQDRVVSLRGDRLTVQVKAEMSHRIPGIVHDTSNSGATLFIEPFAVLDLCNRWRELVSQEERESTRILRELSTFVGDMESDIKLGADLTADIDFIMARARYSLSTRGTSALPDMLSRDEQLVVSLVGARHPLLAAWAVPIDLCIGSDCTVLVITGPNMGGKTVAMKTLGLLAIMQQAGLRVPAIEGSRIPIFDGIYADVGDEQGVRASVSTFGAHMQNVIEILTASATNKSLVLLDELGTSTDPEEGSALAKAILGHLADKGVTTVVTTHHQSVAAFADVTKGLMNASVDLDASTMLPTYRLTTGVSGRSYAMSVAAQLGLPQDILEDARGLMDAQHIRLEDWLCEVRRSREQIKEQLSAADCALADAKNTRAEMDAQLSELVLRREDMIHALRGQLSAQFDEVRRKLRRAESAVSWRNTPTGDVSKARTELDGAKKMLGKLEQLVPNNPSVDRLMAVGDRVTVKGLNVDGVITSLPNKRGEVEVSVGDVRYQLDTRRINPSQKHVENEDPLGKVSYDLGPNLSVTDIHVRGMRAQEALVKVEDFLDKALRDDFSTVRIIHGRGTGVLRRVLREMLERHAHVKAFGSEAQDRGGEGVTVVEFT